MISSVAHNYHSEEKDSSMVGKVILRVTVNIDGSVKFVKIDKLSGYDILDEAAKTSVLK